MKRTRWICVATTKETKNVSTLLDHREISGIGIATLLLAMLNHGKIRFRLMLVLPLYNLPTNFPHHHTRSEVFPRSTLNISIAQSEQECMYRVYIQRIDYRHALINIYSKIPYFLGDQRVRRATGFGGRDNQNSRPVVRPA